MLGAVHREYADAQAFPGRGVEGFLEEGLLLAGAVFGTAGERTDVGHVHGEVAGGVLYQVANVRWRLVGRDGYGRAGVAAAGLQVVNVGGFFAEEVCRFQLNRPGVSVRGPGRDLRAVPGDGGKAHAGSVFGAHQALVPAVFAEGDQQLRVGNAAAVVGDGQPVVHVFIDSVRVGVNGGGQATGAGAAGVLEQFADYVFEAGAVHARHAFEGVGVEAGLDRAGGWHQQISLRGALRVVRVGRSRHGFIWARASAGSGIL